MEQQQPLPEQPTWPAEPTTPMPVQAPSPQGSPGQYGPYYPPTVPAQPAYGTWQQARPGAAPAPRPARMPKGEALALTKKLKSALIAGSVMAFGVLTALAAGHITGVTSRQSNSANASSSNSSAPNTQTAPANNASSDNGGFFNQSPANGSGNGGFGVSNNAPYQPPMTGTSVS